MAEANARKHVLAIDLGTSGPKVALVSTTGEIAGSEFEPTPLHILGGGGFEQEPEAWWRGIAAASTRLIARGLVSADDVAAVSCTGQWSGTVAVDGGGAPLMNAIIWMDTRGAPHVRRLIRGRVSVAGYSVPKLTTWLRLTGGAPTRSGKDPLAHILYLQHERPAVYRDTRAFLEPVDYVNLRLTGRCAASAATITLHWVTDNRDLSHVAYDPALLRLAGIDPDKLPPLKATSGVLAPLTAEAARDLGVRAGVPVVMATPDVHSAAVGSGAVADFEPHLYIGTSSWLTCHVPLKKTSLRDNMASIPSALAGRYLIANDQETAGACLTHLRDSILFPSEGHAGDPAAPPGYDQLGLMAETAPPGSGKLIFTPWLAGERTPVEDPWLRGGFFNQSLSTRREHLVRAVLEGVAYNTRWLLQAVERFAGRRFPAVRMIGGGARSELWCQIHADVLDRPMLQVRDPQAANLRGAALLAALALGLISREDLGHRVAIARRYDPRPENRSVYDELFGAFRELYRRTRGLYAELNRRE